MKQKEFAIPREIKPLELFKVLEESFFENKFFQKKGYVSVNQPQNQSLNTSQFMIFM